MLEVGYLGSPGIQLEQNVQVNNAIPAPTLKRAYYGLTLGPSVQAASAFPITNTVVPVSTINFFPHSAQSNFHGLTTRLERKFTGGFSVLRAFTWSKAISNAPQYGMRAASPAARTRLRRTSSISPPNAAWPTSTPNSDG